MLTIERSKEEVAIPAATRILWVDDHISSYESYVAELEAAGAVVVTSNMPDLALEIAHAQSFDVILVDLKMPKMLGMELLIKLKLLLD